MRVTLNKVVTEMQPTNVNWSDPPILGESGEGMPLRGPYYSCTLSFARVQRVLLQRWRDAQTSGTPVSSIWLPHPDTGKITEFTDVYIHAIRQRQNTRSSRGYVQGVDIKIERIEVS